MVTVPFASLSQGESYTAAMAEPTLVVAGSPAAATRCTELLNNPDLTRRMHAVNFHTTWVVCVFRGRMGSSGYGMAIEEIATAPGAVHLRVRLTDPVPGQNVSDVITYPYHIVLLPRERLEHGPETHWTVTTLDGKVLLHTTLPSSLP
jgi:hypothetical protein